MIFGKPFRKKWYLRFCVCLVSDSFLAWHLKITQHSQQTSKQRTFLKERVKKWQNNTFASNVYICVLVFIINQHNGWKVLIYEIQIKKIHYASMSFLNGRWTRVLALVSWKYWLILTSLDWGVQAKCNIILLRSNCYNLGFFLLSNSYAINSMSNEET